MNRSITRTIILTLITLSITHVHAHTGKTFLMPRSLSVNVAREKVLAREANYCDSDEKWGSLFHVSSFYQQSQQSEELGRYFNSGNQSTQTLTPAQTRLIISDHNGSLITGNHTIRFAPEQTIWGMQVMMQQDLSWLYNNLFMRLTIPFAQVEHDMNLAITGPQAELLKQYFAGSHQVTTAEAAKSAQAPLNYALMEGTKRKNDIAELDVRLGFALAQEAWYKALATVNLGVPCGNTAKGINLFEPIVGNGKHWALGYGFDLVARLWDGKKRDHNLKFIGNLTGRYLIANHQTRTLGLKDVDFAPYHFVAPQNNLTSVQAIPAANILTQRVYVRPGFQISALAGLTYNVENFTLDLGYECFSKQKESVTLPTATPWGDKTYVLITNPGAKFGTGGTADASIYGKPITNADIQTQGATTPATLEHKTYFGLGYICRNWEYPVHIGIAGHYTTAQHNNAIENWGIELKGGIAF